jgi:hypothetical protein
MGECRSRATILDLDTSFTPRPLYLRYPLGKMLGGLQSQSRWIEQEKIFCPCWESNLGRPAHSPSLSHSECVKSSLSEITRISCEVRYITPQRSSVLIYKEFGIINSVRLWTNACYKWCNIHLHLPEDPCDEGSLRRFYEAMYVSQVSLHVEWRYKISIPRQSVPAAIGWEDDSKRDSYDYAVPI